MDKDYKDGFYFIPLGGSEQFGVNLNAYGCDGKWLAVDCGMGFADENFPGIDLLLPDPVFLEQRRKSLVGLMITHAHEDHIGAVPYLLSRLKCPIYCTQFTAAVLRRKLEELGPADAEVIVVNPGDTIRLGPFSVTWLPVTHSIPDTCALVVETPHGRVLHSGDWNLDPTPSLGEPTDPAPFRKAGDKGILAYIGDSTNATVPGRGGSEKSVEEGLTKLFAERQGRIAITIFASNIARIVCISRAAQAAGRRVVLIGRSLHNMVGAAYACGYLKDIPPFVPEADMDSLPDEKTVIIVTGSQGEYRAALAKIARGDFNGISFGRNDTVIFSSRAIPGNEKEINSVKNNLSASGADIISPSDTDHVIHVSGHPYQDEITDMYNWVRPQLVIPVHGERVQIEAQAALARRHQIPALVPSNGSVIRLAPGAPQIVDHVGTGLLAVEPNRILSSDHQSIVSRRKLQYTGAVHITLVIDGKGELVGDPRVSTIGLIDTENEKERKFEADLVQEIFEILDDMTMDEIEDDKFIHEELRIGTRRFVQHMLGIKPKATVHVVRI